MRDHREIGQQLGLFTFLDEYSPGCPVWLPKGTVLYNLLSQKMRELLLRESYVEVKTPVLWKRQLYEKSGHIDHYSDNMFVVQNKGEEISHVIKPMNCPGHMALFASQQFSYRELPYRMHEQTVLHRNEPSGSLGGLTRVRCFAQDDAHIFLAQNQLNSEIHALVDMVNRVYNAFGFNDMEVVVSTRPKEYIGEKELWDKAEHILENVLTDKEIVCTIAEGDGAFYGPKIDFLLRGAAGKQWQTATIQLDFQLPQRFNLKYRDEHNEDQTPIVIHRAIYGSFERFIAMLLEMGDGYLPVGLSPVQIAFLTINDNADLLNYAHNVAVQFQRHNWRIEERFDNCTLNAKIRECEHQRIPLIFVIGAKEAENKTLALRRIGSKRKVEIMSAENAIQLLSQDQEIQF